MDDPETLATLRVQDGQSRDTGNIRCTIRTIQRHWHH